MTAITDLTKSDVRHYVLDHFYSSDTFFGQRTPDEIPHLPARYGDTCIVCGIPDEQLKVDGKLQFHKDGTPVMVPGTATIDNVSVRNGDWLLRAPGWIIIDLIMEKKMTLDGKKLIENSLKTLTTLRGSEPRVTLDRDDVAGMRVLVAHVRWGDTDTDTVCVTVTPRSAVVEGDYGTYAFASNICDPFTFFVGREPNFFYWSEKLVSAPYWHWERDVDPDKLRGKLQEVLDERFGKGEFDANDLPYAERDTPESWYDVLSDAASYNEWGLASEEIGGIVSSSTKPDKCYEAACYILQHVENLAMYGGDNG